MPVRLHWACKRICPCLGILIEFGHRQFGRLRRVSVSQSRGAPVVERGSSTGTDWVWNKTSRCRSVTKNSRWLVALGGCPQRRIDHRARWRNGAGPKSLLRQEQFAMTRLSIAIRIAKATRSISQRYLAHSQLQTLLFSMSSTRAFIAESSEMR